MSDRYAVRVAFWGDDAPGPADARSASGEGGRPLDCAGAGGFRAARLGEAPAGASLSMRLGSPRPFRLWIDGDLAVDEPMSWRAFDRTVWTQVLWPAGGAFALVFQFGPRPRHPPLIDRFSSSRNREAVMARLEAEPDVLELEGAWRAGPAPALSLRHLPAQFLADGVLHQQVLVRAAGNRPAGPPSTQRRTGADAPRPHLAVSGPPRLGAGVEITGEADRAAGLRRFGWPVATASTLPPPLRQPGEADPRPEPRREVARWSPLALQGDEGEVVLDAPVFEPVGRLTGLRPFASTAWPPLEALLADAPEPVLPDRLRPLGGLYQAAWASLSALARPGEAASGAPGGYLSTGSGFTEFQFVWDTAFGAMAARYAPGFPGAPASLDFLYARQFDGGYLHRQHDIRDGSAVRFEPDFSPNPPVMAVAERALAAVTGDTRRLARVYPALAALHRWIGANRRAEDGAFWTSSLASGLDNSPCLGVSHPGLTAQMAQDAEALAEIADALGEPEAARSWRGEREAIVATLNRRHWNAATGFYAAPSADGGHNPNKTVEGFWPLWAGAAPPERVRRLVAHLRDPAAFARPTPVPSLAADSADYDPGGRYWRGSAWPPTTYMVVKGLQRAGEAEFARELAERNLEVMRQVWADTGKLWENYAPEAAAPGSMSMPDYLWTPVGPIALLIEAVLGIEIDALAGRVQWRPRPGEPNGVRRLPFRGGRVSLVQRTGPVDGFLWEVTTDRPFTLQVSAEGGCGERRIAPGAHLFRPDEIVSGSA